MVNTPLQQATGHRNIRHGGVVVPLLPKYGKGLFDNGSPIYFLNGHKQLYCPKVEGFPYFTKRLFGKIWPCTVNGPSPVVYSQIRTFSKSPTMKRQTYLRASLILLLGPLVLGCAPVYIPSAPNVPQLEAQGDWQASAYMGTNGIDLQGSYAVTSNTAVMGTLSGPIASENNDNRHLYLEGAYGVFNRSPSRLRMSAFGGLGWGVARGDASYTVNGTPYNRVSQGIYWKPFLQGNIGLHTDVLDFGLSTRTALVAFQYAELDGQTVDQPLASLMVEPNLYLAFGWRVVKVAFYGGLSWPLQDGLAFEYNPFMLGLGLQFNLPNRGKSAANSEGMP